MTISPQLDYARRRPNDAQFRTGLIVRSVICAGASIFFVFITFGPLSDDRWDFGYVLLAYGLAIVCALAGLVVGAVAVYHKRLGGWFVTVFNLLLLLALLGFAVLYAVGLGRALNQIRG